MGDLTPLQKCRASTDCAKSYRVSSVLMLIIFTQLHGFKYSYLIIIICKRLQFKIPNGNNT